MIGVLRRKRSRRSAPLLATLLLGACASSPPVEFYQLAPVRGTSRVTTAGGALQIARVHLPPNLDRPQMVRQSSAYRLDISDRHRWSAPLDQMIQRSLTEDLLDILPASRVVLPQEPAPPHAQQIVIDIIRFAPDGRGEVRLDAGWSCVSDGATTARSAIVNITVPMQSMSYADQAAAMSTAVAQLAERIARW
jgi:uncharacterized protein